MNWSVPFRPIELQLMGSLDKNSSLELSFDQALDVMNLGLGVYSPLSGFMTSQELESVISNGRLICGSPIGLPILLNVDLGLSGRVSASNPISLRYRGEELATLLEPEIFEWEASSHVVKIFGTDSAAHPGVARFLQFSPRFASGTVELRGGTAFEELKFDSPKAIRQKMLSLGWSTAVGFQTRNVPHRAHEQLIRLALEVYDGVLVHPLVGPRKSGDFTEGAISRAYDFLISNIFPSSRVLLSFLRARMYYGGPREAVLHAIMRRNFGCTHFIVGRDHAGVSGFYGEYESQDYCRSFGSDLGIEVLRWGGPYFCATCDGMVSERSCGHKHEDNVVTRISGTDVREALSSGKIVSEKVMRPAIVKAARAGSLFIA